MRLPSLTKPPRSFWEAAQLVMAGALLGLLAGHILATIAPPARADLMPLDTAPPSPSTPAPAVVARAPAPYAPGPAPTPGAYYSAHHAEAAVRFFASQCRFTDAEWAGRPFALEPWQANDIIRPAFGWRRADGTRLYRRVIVWVPRKNGKTELMAGVSHLLLLGDAEMGGQVYSIAAKEKQARLVFAKAQQMAIYSPGLGGVLEAFKDSLYCPQLNAAFKPLAGIPKGTHGLSASGLIGDEVHEWPNDRLYQFVRQSMAARRQPMEWLISTAGLTEGFGWELWNTSIQIRDGIIADPETLVVIYAADAKDDIHDPAVWAKANPNLGVSVKRAYFEAEAARARTSPRYENDFRRYHLNIWTGQDQRWLPMPDWFRCQTGEEANTGAVRLAGFEQGNRWLTGFDELACRACTVGIDLSSTRDLCAAVYLFEPTPADPRWTALCRFWLPGANIEERVRHERVPYDAWAKAGAITLTEGNAADHRAIFEQIMADRERFEIGQIGFDPWNAHQIMIDLVEAGVEIVKVRQTLPGLTAGAKLLERLVLHHHMDHRGHPILTWMANNVAIESDAAGNIKPSKVRATQKIDGIVALITALALQSVEAERPSYLESAPIVFLS